jgi:hypothetical protein
MKPRIPVKMALDKMPLPAMTLQKYCSENTLTRRHQKFLPCIFSFFRNMTRRIETRHRPGSKKAYGRVRMRFRPHFNSHLQGQDPIPNGGGASAIDCKIHYK